MNGEKRPVRVAIIGAGSAGMAAALALTNHPNKFHVTIFDKQEFCGGMATSIPIDAEKFGAGYINNGVQGGSPQFYNTHKIFEMLGYNSTKVKMQISFGKGKETFWTNVFPSELVAKHAKDIKRFGQILKTIRRLEPFFAVMSIQAMLNLFRFPKDFGNRLVFPLIALFVGTGNQTPHVSAVILERLFLDSSMSLFEYSQDSMLADIPTMYAFPNLHDVYATWQARIQERGAVVKLNKKVTHVLERGLKVVVLKFRDSQLEENVNPNEEVSEFDELIFACDADSCLKILGSGATWKEKKVLGNVKYFHDISVTHYDRAYMEKYYELEYHPDLVAESRKNDAKTQKATEFAEKGFRPLYYIHMYEKDPKKIEMSFDLTHYQPQFKDVSADGNSSVRAGDNHPASNAELSDGSAGSPSQSPAQVEHPHLYQTIFLNKGMEREWTRDEIDKEKIIEEKWWKQQGHNWTHYLGTVPWLWTINGKCHTRYAGGWGLVNMHEVAVCSGFAAAYQLGADYPFNGDDERLFTIMLGVQYLARMRKEERQSSLS